MSDTEAKPVKKPKLDSKATGGLPAGAKPLSHQVAGHQTSGEAQDKGKSLASVCVCVWGGGSVDQRAT